MIDDIKDMENVSPVAYSNYKTDIPHAYFIKILNRSYEPVIHAGTRILVNPNEITLQPNKVYLLSFIENDMISRPLIRLYKEEDKFINLVSKEEELFKQVKVYGCCETLIANFLSIVG